MISKTITYLDSASKNEIIFDICIGQNAQENWDLIGDSKQNSIWFHLDSGMPSPHVVLQIPADFKLKKIPKQVINKTAALCKEYSKYSLNRFVTVIYTEIKNVSKGEKIGSVYTVKTSKIVI